MAGEPTVGVCEEGVHFWLTNQPEPGDECSCRACFITRTHWPAFWADQKPSGMCGVCGTPVDDHPHKGCGVPV